MAWHGLTVVEKRRRRITGFEEAVLDAAHGNVGQAKLLGGPDAMVAFLHGCVAVVGIEVEHDGLVEPVLLDVALESSPFLGGIRAVVNVVSTYTAVVLTERENEIRGYILREFGMWRNVAPWLAHELCEAPFDVHAPVCDGRWYLGVLTSIRRTRMPFFGTRYASTSLSGRCGVGCRRGPRPRDAEARLGILEAPKRGS